MGALQGRATGNAYKMIRPRKCVNYLNGGEPGALALLEGKGVHVRLPARVVMDVALKLSLGSIDVFIEIFLGRMTAERAGKSEKGAVKGSTQIERQIEE